MSGLNTIVPLLPGTLLSAASAELDRQILAMVPPGQSGAVMTIVDASGVRIGLAATYKGAVTVTLEARKGWDKHPPEASLKVKATW